VKLFYKYLEFAESEVKQWNQKEIRKMQGVKDGKVLVLTAYGYEWK
jgi:hypothetical protein